VSSHDASIVVGVVNKLDRRRGLLTTQWTCPGVFFKSSFWHNVSDVPDNIGGAACGCRILSCSCVILTFLASLLFLSVSTSAHLICARLSAYDRSSLYDVFVLRSVDISLFSIWSTYNDKHVVAGYTNRHCFATVQCAKIRRCGLACHAAVAAEPVNTNIATDRPKFTACLTDRAKVDDVIRGIPVVVGYRSTRYLEPGVEYQGRRARRPYNDRQDRFRVAAAAAASYD